MVLGLALFAATILAAAPPRRGRARALPLHDRRGRHRDDGAAAPARSSASRSTAPTSTSTSAASPSSPPSSAKVAIVIFLASYLHDNRQVLVTAGRRVLGLTIPPMKQFGPMLIVWGAAMGTLLLDPRARHLADVLRRLPRAAVRRHRAAVVPADRPRPVRARRVVRGRPRRARARPRARLGTSARPVALQPARRQLPARAVAVRAGRRRAARDRLRPVAAAYPVELANHRSCAARSCPCPKAT